LNGLPCLDRSLKFVPTLSPERALAANVRQSPFLFVSIHPYDYPDIELFHLFCRPWRAAWVVVPIVVLDVSEIETP
jgi:hypothetical protein